MKNEIENLGASWRIVANQEITDIWLSGRAILILILYGIMQSILIFLIATNGELKLIPPKEMVFITLQITLAFGLFLGLVFGANAVSGERDQESLEMLLLTPTSYESVVLGKFVAALTPWPVIFVISTPYLYMLSPNRDVFTLTMIWGFLLGTVLVVLFTAIGVLISVLANSNRTSLSATMVMYVIFLIPTQLPGTAQTGSLGIFIKRINPVESVNQFLEKIIVNNRTVSEMSSWLASPVIGLGVILFLLFGIFAKKLNLFGRLQT